jgi:hypothetical protein
MNAHTPDMANAREQATRMRALWCFIIRAAVDDAIRRERSNGDGAENIWAWSRSAYGRDALECAGINPTTRASDKLASLVRSATSAASAIGYIKRGNRSRTPGDQW